MTQKDRIKKEICDRIGAGMRDKTKIYNEVALMMGVQRPSVRQAAHYLRAEAMDEMRDIEKKLLIARIRSLEARRAEAVALLNALT